jgi:hypothetical protein
VSGSEARKTLEYLSQAGGFGDRRAPSIIKEVTMSSLSSGKRLYIIIAAWLALVLVGGFCTWYGWFGPGSKSDQQEAEATSTAEPTIAAAIPTVEATAVPPTPTTAAVLTTTPQEQEEEVFGYGIAAHGVVGDTDYTMGQVKNLGLGWVKQQVRSK